MMTTEELERFRCATIRKLIAQCWKPEDAEREANDHVEYMRRKLEWESR